MKIAVIGAGPAGLTAAYLLAKEGHQPEVYEASDRVGGLSRTIDLWGYKADLGPHRFFSSDKRVNKLWLEVVGKDYQMVDRLTRIFYKDQFFQYPLKPFDALSKLGIWEAGKCVTSFAAEKIAPSEYNDDFESWVINRFGKRLFNTFFKSYSEKLWGIDCKDLDADFAAQRIKKLSLYEAIVNAIFQNKQAVHKTLVDQFAYPSGGTGMVYERMRTSIESNKGTVLLKTPVRRVLKNRNRAYGIRTPEDGRIKKYDKIISTMPISLLVDRMPDVPKAIKEKANQLKFRNTILVYLEIEETDLFPDNWVYVHSNELKMGRITNFRNWVPDLYEGQKDTLIAIEYWCNYEDDFWSTSEEVIIDLAKAEIRQTGLVGDQAILKGKVVKIPRCYPVYQKGYKDNLQPIERYLSEIENLSIIGRYGAFKYNNQDHSILMGILAAENILKGQNNNLWGVNTDYEVYQEQSVITETGLVVM